MTHTREFEGIVIHLILNEARGTIEVGVLVNEGEHHVYDLPKEEAAGLRIGDRVQITRTFIVRPA